MSGDWYASHLSMNTHNKSSHASISASNATRKHVTCGTSYRFRQCERSASPIALLSTNLAMEELDVQMMVVYMLICELYFHILVAFTKVIMY
jgi:hypothetical protein